MKTTRPESEAPVPAGWFGDLHDDIRSMIAVGDGKTVFVDHLPTGQVIRVKLPVAVSAGGVSGGGSIGIGVVTTPPPAGGGPGAYRKITLAADGSWEAVGEEIPIVFPAI